MLIQNKAVFIVILSFAMQHCSNIKELYITYDQVSVVTDV